MLAEIGDPERAEVWLADALASKRKIMGFGHRVYKQGDSRVPTMESALVALASGLDASKLMELYERLAAGDAGDEGDSSEPGLSDWARLPPDGFRHTYLHADLRDEPNNWLDGARYGAIGSECTYPAAERLRVPRETFGAIEGGPYIAVPGRPQRSLPWKFNGAGL